MPPRSRKPVDYRSEHIDDGTAPWLKTAGSAGKSRGGGYDDDDTNEENDEVERRLSKHHRSSGDLPSGKERAGGGNAKGRKKDSNADATEHGASQGGANRPLQQTSKHNSANKRLHSNSDEQPPVAGPEPAKKPKHAQEQQQREHGSSGRSGGLKTLEDMAREQEEEREAAAHKSRARSKPSKHGTGHASQAPVGEPSQPQPRHSNGNALTAAADARPVAQAAQPAVAAAAPAAAATAAAPAPARSAKNVAPSAPAAGPSTAAPAAATAAAAPAAAGPSAATPAGSAQLSLGGGAAALLQPVAATPSGNPTQAFLQLQRQYTRLQELYQQLKVQKITQFEGLMEEQEEYVQGRQTAMDQQVERWQRDVEEAARKVAGVDALTAQLMEAQAEVLELKRQCTIHEQGAVHLQAEVARLKDQLAAALAAGAAGAEAAAAGGDAVGGEAGAATAAGGAGAGREIEGTTNLEPRVGSEGARGESGSVRTPAGAAAGLGAHAHSVALQCPTPVAPSPGIGCQFPTPGMAHMEDVVAQVGHVAHMGQQTSDAFIQPGGVVARHMGTTPMSACTSPMQPPHGGAPMAHGRAAAGGPAARSAAHALVSAWNVEDAGTGAPDFQTPMQQHASTSCMATMPSPSQPRPAGSMMTELAAGGALFPMEPAPEADSCNAPRAAAPAPVLFAGSVPFVAPPQPTSAERASASNAARPAGVVAPHVVHAAVAPVLGQGGVPAHVTHVASGEQGSVNDPAQQRQQEQQQQEPELHDSPVEGLRTTAQQPAPPPPPPRALPAPVAPVTSALPVTVATSIAARLPAGPPPPPAPQRAPPPAAPAAAAPPPHIRSRPPPAPAPPAPPAAARLPVLPNPGQFADSSSLPREPNPDPTNPQAGPQAAGVDAPPAVPQLTAPNAEPTVLPSHLTHLTLGGAFGIEQPSRILTASTPSLVLGGVPDAAAAAAATGPTAIPLTFPPATAAAPLRPAHLAANQAAMDGLIAAAQAGAMQLNRPSQPLPQPGSNGSVSVVGPLAPAAAATTGPATQLVLPPLDDLIRGSHTGWLGLPPPPPAAPQPQHSPQMSIQGSTSAGAGAAAARAADTPGTGRVPQPAALRRPNPGASPARPASPAPVASPLVPAAAPPEPSSLHEVAAMIRAATPGKPSGGADGREALGGGAAKDVPLMRGASQSPGGLASRFQSAYQQFFHWELQDTGEGGLYAFHHTKSGLRLSLRRIIAQPEPGASGGGGTPQGSGKGPSDAQVVRDDGLVELMGRGAVLWQYQLESTGTAGPLLPDYLKQEFEVPEKQATVLIMNITRIIMQAEQQ